MEQRRVDLLGKNIGLAPAGVCTFVTFGPDSEDGVRLAVEIAELLLGLPGSDMFFSQK